MFDENFRKDPNIIQLAPKVLLYKNFINGDLLNKINDLLKKHHHEHSLDHEINWYSDRVTKIFFETLEIWEKASDFIYPELVMHPQGYFLISQVGDSGMFVHCDAPGEPHENCGSNCSVCDINKSELISGDFWDTCCRLHYGIIIYFGDFEGGEIFYPNISKDGKYVEDPELFLYEKLTVKVSPGDMVIHGAHKDYAHGTMPVTRGVRYAFSNFALPRYANPGTFYNYKSKEYLEQIEEVKKSKDLSEWVKPIK